MRFKRFQRLFDKLADAEEQFLKSVFLAPVVERGEVRVRIASVVCRLTIRPAGFEGWGVFRPTSHSTAELVRTAELAERKRYLELFPLVRLVLCRRENDGWHGLPAHAGDGRFRIEGLVPVRLVDDAEQFEIVRTRFDGSQFWFEDVDPSRDPAIAQYLRQSLNQTVEPNQIERSGLTPEEKSAYVANYLLKEEVRRQLEAEKTADKLEAALKHAGAELVDYLERRDGYRVTYTIRGRQHVSAVAKRNLSVQVAGICLSGRDQQFDLASLVGVIREAEEGRMIVPVGEENRGMEEGQYWDVHPPNP